jgi:hypothetical protein
MAERRRADRKVAHQLLDHDAWGHAQDPGVEKEEGARQPAEQRRQR